MGVQKAWEGEDPRRLNVIAVITAVRPRCFERCSATEPVRRPAGPSLVVVAVHVMFNIDDDFRENHETSRPAAGPINLGNDPHSRPAVRPRLENGKITVTREKSGDLPYCSVRSTINEIAVRRRRRSSGPVLNAIGAHTLWRNRRRDSSKRSVHFKFYTFQPIPNVRFENTNVSFCHTYIVGEFHG